MTPLGVEVFGTFAVATMLLCYAAEDFAPGFVLGFASACLASSVYAALIGSWPFMAIELLWSVVALRRWHRAGRSQSRQESRHGGKRRRLHDHDDSIRFSG